ncbi:MAG: substrate-binding domain-containing protein [Lachnospiraceae bacterium]|nr:substrate-binding domain-containing protein [Lachnospiraceae bacterium]
MKKKKRLDENKKLFLAAAAILVFVLAVTVGGMVFFKQQVRRAAQALEETEYREYDRYYAMIVEDADSAFWQEVYEGACMQAEENNACVELLNDMLAEKYSREELMHIAVESQVDGIIVQADESERLTACIDEAVDKGIPVITVLGDNTAGKRQSFVGVGSYNLGREYGRQVLEMYQQREPVSGKVYVLMDTKAEDSSQNILYSGIQETISNLDIGLEMYAVNNESRFSVEESIRDLFMNTGEQPDIIICLDELNTSCVYQAVVDYNRVGEVGIIGYYDSEDILRAIERNVIYSTITVDTAQMGGYCVEALKELDESGNVSEYFAVDIHLVNAQNVDAYLEREEADEK